MPWRRYCTLGSAPATRKGMTATRFASSGFAAVRAHGFHTKAPRPERAPRRRRWRTCGRACVAGAIASDGTGCVCVGVIPPLERGERLERRHQFVGGLESVGGALGEAAHDGGVERGREAGALLRHRDRRLGDVRGQRLLRVEAGERRVAGEHLVAHHAHGIDIDPRIHLGIGGGLFRRHVRRGAECDADAGEVVLAGGLGDGLGDAEVHHHGVAAGEEDVLGLDVAMDHAGPVGDGERLGDLGEQPHRLGHRQLAGAGQAIAQGLALDVGHDVVEEAVGVAGVEDAEDVRMLEAGGDLDLAGEALGAECGGQLGAEDLDGDAAVVLEVFGEIDGGHATLAELTLDAVAAGEGGGKPGDCAVQRVPLVWVGVDDNSAVRSSHRPVGRAPRLAERN